MNRKATKIGMISLGCPKNRVDSEVMLGHLSEHGFALTDSEREAEVLVVNTCGFIEPAKGESIKTILEIAELKREGGCRKLIVTGCLVERYRDQIQRQIPEVDAVLGVNELADIVQICETGPSLAEGIPEHRSALYLYDDQTPRVLSTPGYTAYVKIAEGCDHTCAFCIIPALRGVHRSRPIDSIVREIQSLADKGVREINLVSQDSTQYGADLGLRHGLADLMTRLVRVEGIEWFRVMYSHPNRLDPEYLEVMAREPKICSYLDLPLQHASGKILKRMRRGGDAALLRKQLEQIRERVPDISLRTTMIVGFPGETEKDFLELVSFCREAQFDHLGVFTYFDEEGTPAFEMIPKVPDHIKSDRKRRLMKQQAAISLARNRRRVGETLRILIEGPSEESEWILQGRTSWQAPEIDGRILITDSELENIAAGQFRHVKITQALEHDLIGRIVASNFRI